MKKIKLILTLLFITANVFANEVKTIMNGKVRFEIPKSPLIDYNWEKNDRFSVVIRSACWKNEDLKNLEENSLSPVIFEQIKKDNYTINKKNLVNVMTKNDISKTKMFCIKPSFYELLGEMWYANYPKDSYKPLLINNEKVGESYMSMEPIKYEIRHEEHKYFNINYNISFVLEDRIVFLHIDLRWGDSKSVYEICPELFEKRADGKVYWKNQESQEKFYEIFNSDEYKKLPETIRLVRETRDTILSTLQINEAGFKD